MARLDDLSIGDFAHRTGCGVETIRYYESVGVLPVPRRRGRYRRYGAEDVGLLTFVRRARELGFTLDEVRALLGLATGGPTACAEARDIAAAHLDAVRARIADLRAMERVLADTVRRCEVEPHDGCPLIETLSGNATG